jgi:hypothetical protein
MKLYFCYEHTDCFFTGKTLLAFNKAPASLSVYAVIDAECPQQLVERFMRDISSEDAPYSDKTLSTPINQPVGVVFSIYKSILDTEVFSHIQYTSWCASEPDDIVVKTVRTLEKQESTLRLTKTGKRP